MCGVGESVGIVVGVGVYCFFWGCVNGIMFCMFLERCFILVKDKVLDSRVLLMEGI